MFRLEKTLTKERYSHKRDNPSFSSSLLDQICRSIDYNDGIADTKNRDLKFNRETMQKKQSKGNMKSNGIKGSREEEEIWNLQRACLIEKWMEKKVSEKKIAEKKPVFKDFKRKSHHDHDNDVIFSSSSSSSSDSSSGGFSSSDTESMYGKETKAPCFVPPRPKPVRTSVSARPEKPLFYERREFHMFDDHTPKTDETILKSKSRAMKIYGNLKKVKLPISPGGRLASFINSLFTTNTKKTKNSSSILRYDDDDDDDDDDERKLKSIQVSTTCSSASSFSRSCLNQNSPSTREKLRDGVKRTVRFCPVIVIVDEDSRPCGQKCLFEEEGSRLLPVSVPTAWKIGKSPSRKYEEEVKFQITEKSKRVEENAREFIEEYQQDQKNNSHYYYDDDDAASDSSSDLFELDHLVLMGNDRFKEEFPVYETTHVETNQAIANGLIA